MTPIKTALDNIKKNNEKAQAASTLRSFLLYLIDIIKPYQAELEQIVKLLEQEKINDIGTLKILDEKLFEKQRKIYTELKTYKEKNKLGKISRDLEGFFEEDPKKRIDTTRELQIAKKTEIENELAYIVNISSAHAPFVSKFATIMCRLHGENRSGMVGYCPIDRNLLNLSLEFKCDDFEKWLKEKNHIERLQISKEWYHWDIVFKLYNVYMHAENRHQELIDAGCFFQAADVSIIYNILDPILRSTQQNDNPCALDLKELKYSLQKIIDFTDNKINSLVVSKKRQKNTFLL